jgi:hypothetical protein
MARQQHLCCHGNSYFYCTTLQFSGKYANTVRTRNHIDAAPESLLHPVGVFHGRKAAVLCLDARMLKCIHQRGLEIPGAGVNVEENGSSSTVWLQVVHSEGIQGITVVRNLCLQLTGWKAFKISRKTPGLYPPGA